MKVNLNTDYNTNFGQLYIHKGVKLSRVYRYNEQIANFVKPDAASLAEDVDIHIWLRNLLQNGFDITIGKVVKSPLKRALGLYGKTVKKHVRPWDCKTYGPAEVLFCNIKDGVNEYKEIQAEEK